MPVVHVLEEESFENALRRFKRKVEKSGILTELRKRGVAAVQAGESPPLVAAALGVNLRTLFRWLSLYRRGGWHQQDARKRGGRPPKLDGSALRWIYNTLANKNPLQLKFPFALWTAAMVQTLIAERYKVKLSHSSVCRLLHQLGLSAQRPLWRAYQQNPEAVKQWLETDYPAIRRRAKRARAQIFFADEAGVRSDFHSGTTWGRRGRTPVVSSTGARFGANLISAISAQGQLRFMLTKGRVTAAVFTEFLKRLLINASAPIFVIVDGHPTHRAKSVARFVAAQADKLELEPRATGMSLVALSRPASRTRRVRPWAIIGLMLGVFVVAGVAAALHHHWARHDGVLRRMWPARHAPAAE